MSELKQRDWLVRVGSREGGEGVEIKTLDIEFEVEKSLRAEPNKCSLTIYNLAPDTRKKIEQLNTYDPKKVKGSQAKSGSAKKAPRAPKTGLIRVEIEAGYKGSGRSLIFRGDLRRSTTTVEETTVKTTIEGEDGGKSITSSRINESFPAGTPRLAVVQAAAEAAGVGLGNLIEVSDLLSGVVSHGTTLSGQAYEELTGFIRRQGLSVSIQNGVLQFRRRNPLLVEGYVLSPTSGLIGSPERDTTGAVIARTLLLPNISAGQRIGLQSRDYNGSYEIIGIRYIGQSAGAEWYAECELMPA